ncbi:MAG: hypothetical protein H8K06_00210 [Nitrospira sp.]|nr:hypothetical protein [Nitrospira sp.]
MMADLDFLRSQLDVMFSRALHSREHWGESQAMSRALKEIRQRHDSPAECINERTIAMAVADFMKTGQLSTFRDLKYVCLGAASIDKNGQCLLAERSLRDKLLALCKETDEPRRQMKCFQSLLRSYWSFPLNSSDLQVEARDGWIVLRAWLAKQQKSLDAIATKPEWFIVISRHLNLLDDNPCDRYGPALLRGDGTELDRAIKELAIPTESWVMEEAILAQIKAASTLGDADFNDALPQMVALAQGKAGVDVSKPLATRCVSLLVTRYARCASTPEHMGLRDAAISVIGNPWLRRTSWDAHVRDDKGRPNHAAREMINGWLKRRLIRDFFELLSADGTGDTRRLDYWLRFEPVIDDMWFALGANARDRRGESFNDFRHRARGRLLGLDQTTSDNNAFVMRIGEYLAVEFGVTNHAFFLFRWDRLPPVLTQVLTSGKERAFVSIHSLKSSENQDRLIHRDQPSSALSWEQKFDAVICPLIGSHPQEGPRRLGYSKPAHAPPWNSSVSRGNRTPMQEEQFNWPEFEKFIARHRLQIEDRRLKGGALWVRAADILAVIADPLKNWGFRYKPGKGWWKE